MLDSTGLATAGLDRPDDAHAGGVAGGDLAEDDVAAVEPRGDDGGDEELGAVAVESRVSERSCWESLGARWQGKAYQGSRRQDRRHVRVRAGVGHGEQERLVVGELEVLVGELFTVDGLSTSALEGECQCRISMCFIVFS